MQHDGGMTALAPAEVVATWPKGSFAENLAIDGEGAIHVTLHTDHAVVRVDPATRAVSPFATYATPVAGVVFGPDGTLYVSGGQPGTPGGVIWATGRDGSVRRLAVLPDAAFLNGMTLHPDGRLLVAESIGGTIYAVDLATGSAVAWMQDERLRPPVSDGTPGANGIKLHGGYAYVSVTARDLVVRAPLDHDGAAGAIEVVAERLRADDFAIAADGSLIIATHPAHADPSRARWRAHHPRRSRARHGRLDCGCFRANGCRPPQRLRHDHGRDDDAARRPARTGEAGPC